MNKLITKYNDLAPCSPTTYMIHDRTRCTFGYLQKS